MYHEVWSPGSTTTTSSTESLGRHERKHHHPVTTASATQTTPTRSESLPRGFRPVRLTTFQQQPTVTQSQSNTAPTLDTTLNNSTSSNHNNNNNNITSANNNNQQAPCTSINDHSHPHPSNLDQDLGPLSPSTISEISIETSDTKQQRLSPPSSPQVKYWTLPRSISIGSSKDSPAGSKDRRFGGVEREAVRRTETPSDAKLVYESPSKYFTLPVKTSSTSEKPRSHSVPAVPKYPGIGPVTENGIPLALRSVSSNSFLARSSYSPTSFFFFFPSCFLSFSLLSFHSLSRKRRDSSIDGRE